jgi:hypothetical protein
MSHRRRSALPIAYVMLLLVAIRLRVTILVAVVAVSTNMRAALTTVRSGL